MELKWIPGPCHSPSLILRAAPPARPGPGRTPCSGCREQLAALSPGFHGGRVQLGTAETESRSCRGDSNWRPRWDAEHRPLQGRAERDEVGSGVGVFQSGPGEFARSRNIGKPPPARNRLFHALYFAMRDLPRNLRDPMEGEEKEDTGLLQTGSPRVPPGACTAAGVPSVTSLRGSHRDLGSARGCSLSLKNIKSP